MSQFACKPHDSESAMTEASGGWSGIQVAERRTEGALAKVKRIFSVHDVAEVGFAIEHQDVQDPRPVRPLPSVNGWSAPVAPPLAKGLDPQPHTARAGLLCFCDTVFL